jgi:sugar phosphate isomerase/epimerase
MVPNTMQPDLKPSRRNFVSSVAGSSLALALANNLQARGDSKIPIGLELYSVRHELEKDATETLDRVGQMGYDCVEFFSPYVKWTPDHAKEVRAQLDKLKLKCYSTHNGRDSFSGEGMEKAIELNKILGCHYIVMSHPGSTLKTIDEWKKVSELLNEANSKMKSEGLHAGYHNHDLEWKPIDGQKPIEVLAQNTDKSIMLQLDVGTCLETGNDPVAWIKKNPGRIKSMHLKEWAPDTGYKALFGEGKADWKQIFAAGEKHGGVEYYLIEQEGSRFPEFETAERCLVAYKNLRSGKKA